MSSSRRDFIAKAAGGLAGIILVQKCPAIVIKSNSAGRKNVFDAETKVVPSAQEYIQDGLLCFWDGIENVDYGAHDSSSLVWTDLAGNGFDLTVDPECGEWGKDCIIPYNFQGCKCPAYYTNARDRFNAMKQYPITVEFVGMAHLGDADVPVCFSYCNNMYQTVLTASPREGSMIGKNGSQVYIDIPRGTVTKTMTWSCSDGYVFINGIDMGETSSIIYLGSWGYSATHICIAGEQPRPNHEWQGRGYPYRYPLHSIRAYNRILSQEEAMYNHQIDKLRFNLK